MDRKESQQDERIAAEDVILLYKGLLYYVIRPIVANENLLDDCYSEICQIIISNYEKYDEKKGSLTAWLTRVARNGALNFKNNKKNIIMAGEEDNIPEIADYDTPEDQLIRKENRKELADAINTLSREELNLLLRKYYYMQSTKQIGAELGLSERAVEGKLYRIKKKLIKKIGGQDDA